MKVMVPNERKPHQVGGIQGPGFPGQRPLFSRSLDGAPTHTAAIPAPREPRGYNTSGELPAGKLPNPFNYGNKGGPRGWGGWDDGGAGLGKNQLRLGELKVPQTVGTLELSAVYLRAAQYTGRGVPRRRDYASSSQDGRRR